MLCLKVALAHVKYEAIKFHGGGLSTIEYLQVINLKGC